MIRRSLAALLGALGALWSGPAAAAPPPPEAFGRLPAVQSAAISPDGQAIALISGTADKRLLSIAGIDRPDPVVLDLGSVRTSGVRWAGDGYLLVRITTYAKPGWSKHGYNYTRDLIVNRKGGGHGWLLNNARDASLLQSFAVYRLVGGERPIAYVGAADGDEPALWKVDVATGRGTLMERDAAYATAVGLDGKPRARLDQSGPETVLSIRQKGRIGWKTVAAHHGRNLSLLGYGDPEDAVYWSAEDGPGSLVRVRRTSLEDGATTSLEPPEPSGEAGVLFDAATGAAVAVWSNAERTRYRWLDPRLGAAHAGVERLFKGMVVHPAGWSADRSRVVMRVVGADAPARWVLYDAGRKEVSVLGEEYPELKPGQLGKVAFITYRARDGLEIPAYLHLPPGREGRALPLVVLPHGGPASRDEGEFDWQAQFIASRGYAVLQPQFRGSDGWGYEFRKAGDQEWAGKMQTDLLDGVAHLAAKGVADPKRVCIVGSSYGGYAALRGITLYPESYRCAVSVNGISDPATLVAQTAKLFDIDKASLSREFGDTRQEIAKTSPAQGADRIGGPVLMIYSAQDTTVPPEQSKAMHARLKEAGKASELVELPGDDHHLMTSASRIRLLAATEAFLAKNLPPD
ncbi:MAG TPA: alpha/beta fold hydrolase [Caulobacteraceae bacterium]|jgi:dipeptidyl aminopeptidase/acylaminoacyl peptidase